MLFVILWFALGAGFAVGCWVADPHWSLQFTFLRTKRIRPRRHHWEAWEIAELYDADRYWVNGVEEEP